MRRSRFTETQIVAILNAYDAGTQTAELARKHDIHPNTLRQWRAKYGGMDARRPEATRRKTRKREDPHGVRVTLLEPTSGLEPLTC